MSASAAPTPAAHIPVMLDEVVAALSPKAGEVHVDGTFGAGGYTQRILASGARVIAIDRDPDAIAGGQALVTEAEGRLALVPGVFSDLVEIAERAGHAQVDGVTLDIGVSSMQIDQAARGFAFAKDGPLDMRMSQAGASAADWVNTADEAEIADVLYRYGEERQSRRVARFIVAARPLARTGELANVVRRALGYRPGAPKDPATRSFQAIRIAVNDELSELERGLDAAERALAPGGRLAIVTFHSLEDRIVKLFFRTRSGAAGGTSRHMPMSTDDGPAPTFSHVAKPVRASEAECARNPRARSATLRAAVRTSAPEWSAHSSKETVQ
ncbi:MAG: 16S rRNA (cytosine(1402)-N(4))-methyltransferase RsmH [Sphingopyxis sp.]